MKYRLELILDRPRAEVWKIFDDPDNMNKWQPSLVKLERVSGTAGRPGSVTELTFKNDDREFSLTEEVTFRAEPERLDGFYKNVLQKTLCRIRSSSRTRITRSGRYKWNSGSRPGSCVSSARS